MDYKKAYGMAPHSWIIESLKLINVSENIVKIIQQSMSTWKTEITECGQTLGEVEINREIFHGICIKSLSNMLREMKAVYIIDNEKTNNLLLMDDLRRMRKKLTG